MKIFQKRWLRRTLACLAVGTAIFGYFQWRDIKNNFPEVPVDSKMFFLNLTGSLPRGLYLKVPIWDEIHDDDYVVYTPPETVKLIGVERGWMKDDAVFLKKVGALEGEAYHIDEKTLQFYARGNYVGQVTEKDGTGQPMPVLRGEYVVPIGEFLPIGTNPRSFDGRYTGTVPLKNIHAKVIPILTEFYW